MSKDNKKLYSRIYYGVSLDCEVDELYFNLEVLNITLVKLDM